MNSKKLNMKELYFPWTSLCNCIQVITEISSMCIFANGWIFLQYDLGLDLAA